jgi:hypothetical protein
MMFVIAMAAALQLTPESMDFWVGDWDVFSGGKHVGVDKVEVLYKGAALMEDRKGDDSPQDVGKSFFYWRAGSKSWKQVWVVPGRAYKEKIAHAVPGGMQFVGTVYLPNGKTIDDRTTLTANGDGTVHQVIEQKKNGQWIVGFDALYRRRK